jgi:hypothetical protein
MQFAFFGGSLSAAVSAPWLIFSLLMGRLSVPGIGICIIAWYWDEAPCTLTAPINPHDRIRTTPLKPWLLIRQALIELDSGIGRRV